MEKQKENVETRILKWERAWNNDIGFFNEFFIEYFVHLLNIWPNFFVAWAFFVII